MNKQLMLIGLVACMAVMIAAGSAAADDALLAVSADGTSVWRYDAALQVVAPVSGMAGLGTVVYDVEPLPNGDALVASDGDSGRVALYDGALQAGGPRVMSFAGTIWKMTAVSDGDALIPISWQTHVWRYDSAGRTTALVPPGWGMGNPDWYEDSIALPDGGALVAADGAGGKLHHYDGGTKQLGPQLMSFGGTMGPMVAVGDGDALIPVSASGAEIWRFNDDTKTVPDRVGQGMGTQFYDSLGLPNGDALIASDGLGGKVVRYDSTAGTIGGAMMTFAGVVGPMAAVSDGDALIPITAGAQVWRYDAATQAVFSKVAEGAGTLFYDVEPLASGDALIASDGAGGKVVRYDGVTKTTGGSLMTFAGEISDLLALPDGDALIFAGTSGGSLWRYDAASQSVVGPVGTFMGTLFDMEVLVPEPATVGLLGLGAALACLTRRCRAAR